jgi:hypothetical protein
MADSIKLDVYVSPYKPIVSLLPTWDAARRQLARESGHAQHKANPLSRQCRAHDATRL